MSEQQIGRITKSGNCENCGRWISASGHICPTRQDQSERFWSKVDASGDCWEWTARRHRGYGIFPVGGKFHSAHRWAYEALCGTVPPGMQIDHLCRNRSCVNPDHLQVVTPLVNSRRGFRAKATHCKQGHEFTPENTYIQIRPPNGQSRSCLTCRRTFYPNRYKAVAA